MSEIFTPLVLILVVPFMVGSILPADAVGAAYRWLVGLLIIGMTVMFAHAFGLTPAIAVAVITSLSVVGVVRLWNYRRLRLRPGWLGLVAICLLLSVGIYTWSEVLRMPLLSWDATAIWFNKARFIYSWGPLFHIPVNTYPNLGPSMWAYVMSGTGLIESAGRLVFPTAYVVWLASLINLKGSRHATAANVIVVCGLGMFLLSIDIWNGYQDMLLAVYAAAAAALLTASLHRHSNWKWQVCLGVFFAGSLYLIKNEGAFLGTFILSAYAIATLLQLGRKRMIHEIRSHRRLAGLCLLLFLIPAALWIVALLAVQLDPTDVQGGAFSLSGLLHIPDKLGNLRMIASRFFREFILIWPMIVLAVFSTISVLVLARRRRVVIANVCLWLIVILHLVFLTVTFLATNADLHWHLQTAAHRLLTQHELIYVLILLENVGILIDKWHKPGTDV